MKKPQRPLVPFCLGVLLVVAFSFTSSSAQITWNPERRVTNNTGVSYTSPNPGRCVALGGGYIHVVFRDDRDHPGSYEVYYARSSDGGVHWTETRISTHTPPNEAEYPTIAVSGSVVHIAWNDYSNMKIWYRSSPDYGTSWPVAARQISSSGAWAPPSSSVSLAASGLDVHIVWDDGRLSPVWTVYYLYSPDNGVNWNTEKKISNTPGIGASHGPCVAVNGANVHVVFADNRDGGNNSVYYTRSTDKGATWPQSDTRITFVSSGSECPSVAASGSKVHVVWEDYRDGIPGASEIYYKRSDNGGAKWPATDVRLTLMSKLRLNPAVALSGSDVHVVWTDYRDPPSYNSEIYYKHSPDNGTSWESDVNVSTIDQKQSDLPSVVAEKTMNNATVHVVWQDLKYGIGDNNWEILYRNGTISNPNQGSPSGIEISSQASTTHTGLRATPNPFVSFSSVPGHEQEMFALHDISGKQVGTYQGSKVGSDVSPGIYFLRSLNKENTQVLRIVKVR